jgi:hypothetical protein
MKHGDAHRTKGGWETETYQKAAEEKQANKKRWGKKGEEVEVTREAE